MSISSIITAMTTADAMKPIIALEATVVSGRTIQAYKRGGKDEARERLIEESTGSIVWLCGVKLLNDLGDKLLSKYLNSNGHQFDVGTDKILRKPFENFIKNGTNRAISPKKLAILKGIKVASSILIANLFIGFAVPKINQSITRKVLHKKHILEKEQNNNNNKTITNSNQGKKQTFKGGFSALNVFTNAIENTNTGKLLSTDVGIAGGRIYSARNNDERREIAIRDIGSIYFYMWAQGHVRNLLNFIETGKFNRIDPNSVEILHKHISSILEKNHNELSVEEFKQLILGTKTDSKALSEDIKSQFKEKELSSMDKFFNKFKKIKKEPLRVAKVSDLESIITDKAWFDRIKQMSELQPKCLGEALVTEQQVLDAKNVAEINNPELLHKIFNKFTKGAYKDEYKYVSYDKLYNLKSLMENYVERICSIAKDKKVTTDVINKCKRENMTYSGINFVVGFAVAAAFLSTIIPKIQYWVTQLKTGVNAFPGTYDYKNHKEIDV